MKRDLAIRALKMAIAFRHHPKAASITRIVGRNTVRITIKRSCANRGKGNCYNNAAVETFFKTIKAQLISRRSWETRRQAEMAIFEYINGFYNPRRRHSALGWKSPVAFERKVA
jgi:transposase InsO family protein